MLTDRALAAASAPVLGPAPSEQLRASLQPVAAGSVASAGPDEPAPGELRLVALPAPAPDVPEPPDTSSAGLEVLGWAPVAAGAELRTEEGVTFTLSDLIVRDARLNGLRADDRLGDTGGAGDDESGPQSAGGRAGGALGLHLLAPRPVTLMRRDVPRPAWTARLDTTNRVQATKCASALGWNPGDALIARIDRTGQVPLVVITPGVVAVPTEHAVTLDPAGRFRLAPTLVGALGLTPRSQLMLTALPTLNQAAVFALDDVVPVITSVLLGLDDLPTTMPAPKPEQPAPPARRTNVRAPWAAAKAS